MLVFDIASVMFQYLVKFCSKFIILEISIAPTVYYFRFFVRKILKLQSICCCAIHNLVSRVIFKNSLFRFLLIAKRCAGDEVE